MNDQPRAEIFLREQLRDGAKHGRELVRLAQAKGISESTLLAAKRVMRVQSVRESFGRAGRGRWVWRLDPVERQRELRARLLDHLLEEAERPDLTAAERARLKQAADELSRKLLADDPGAAA